MAKKEKTPTGELRDVDVQFVSLVKRGANKRTFQIFKSADYKDDEQTGALEDETKQAVGFFKMMKEFFTGGGKAAIEKADTVTVEEPATFQAVMAAEEARSQTWRIFDAISTVFWNIVRSDSDNKRQLMEQSLDEFKTKVLETFDKLNVKKKVSKSEEIEIEKAGRKISAERLQALIAARDHLNKVIEETSAAEQNPASPEITLEKEDEIDMKPEELQQILKSAIGEALAPVTQRLEKLEKGADDSGADGGDGSGEQPAGELTAEAISKSVKDAVAEAIKPIDERLTKIEKAYPMSNQPDNDGEGEQHDVSKSDNGFWGGLFTTQG